MWPQCTSSCTFPLGQKFRHVLYMYIFDRPVISSEPQVKVRMDEWKERHFSHIVITVFLIISSFASPCRSMNTLPAHLFTLSLPQPLESALHKTDING
jgi:hypothetical protein